jgi:hypothetical protein
VCFDLSGLLIIIIVLQVDLPTGPVVTYIPNDSFEPGIIYAAVENWSPNAQSGIVVFLVVMFLIVLS